MSAAEPKRREKILVTGAGGFIGRHLAAELVRRGQQVVALDLSLGALRHLQSPGHLECVEGDVADEGLRRRSLEGVDTVFHLAAAHLSLTDDEDHYRRVNVTAVRGLARDVATAGVRRLVHCSSVGVHGTITDPPADEDSPCRPEIPYERTKLEGERLLLEAHRSQGLPVVILRPVWVYGPGCPRTEKLFRAIAGRRFLVAGQALALRHCLYIRDMVEAFLLAAAAERAMGRVVIVGDEGAVPVRRLIEEIASLTGAPPPRRVPLPLLRATATAAELVFRSLGREPPLSRRTLKFFTANTSFETSRSRRLLGFRPAYSLTRGLAETHALLQAGQFWTVPLPGQAEG